MAVKTYKPYTPSRRFMIWYSFEDLTASKPQKNLRVFKKSTWGRNNQWRVTSRFMWWGHKRLLRLIDFRGYDKEWIPSKVATIEYDPYRTSRIALLNFVDGEKRYVLARKGIKVGQQIAIGKDAPIENGNRKQLKDIPEGYTVFNVELTPFTKGKLIKSAWWFATIVGKDEGEKKVFVKMSSGEVRKFDEKCWATIWQVWNEDHKNVVIGKAWRQRWKGIKPHVLGKAMNPVDHPHGGGEWHTEIWLKKWPKSFSGKVVAPGIKTRKGKKWSDKFIVTKRKK